MEYFLPSTINNDIYRYLGWYELKDMRMVPNEIWKLIYDRFCDNDEFREALDWYRKTKIMIGMKCDDTLEYKTDLLKLINHAANHVVSGNMENFPKILWGDQNFILPLIKYQGDFKKFFKCVHSDLNANRNFMMSCIKQNSKSFKYASAELKTDKHFVSRILDISPRTLKYVGANLKDDRELVLKAIRKDYQMISDCLDKKWLNDKEVALEIVLQKPNMINSLPENVKRNPDFILKALKAKNPEYIIDYALSVFKENWDVLLEIIKQRWSYIKFFPVLLRSDINFMKAAMKCDIRVAGYVDKSIRYRGDYVRMFIECENKIFV